MPYIVGAVVLVVLIVIGLAFRSGSTPSPQKFQEVRAAIIALQDIANSHIAKDDGKLHGTTQAEIEKLTRSLWGSIRFVYTIDEEDGQFIHTVSSQLTARKPRKYQIECMLMVILTLNQQLEAAGIDPKTVTFDVAQSELGTHYVAIALAPEQHRALMASHKA